MNSLSKKIKNIYVQYTLFFVVISFFWVFQYIVFNKTLIWEIDGYAQCYGILAKFKSILISIFSGNGLALWQWDIGLGGDLIGNLSQIIMDPFMIICAFFSRTHLDVAYTIMIFLKIYTAGIIVLKYLKYKNKSLNMCVIGAISYAFCTWTLAGVVHVFFISQLIIFPLIIW